MQNHHHEDRMTITGFQGLLERGNGRGEMASWVRGFTFGVIEILWIKVELVLAQHLECTNATELFTLKWLILYNMNFTSVNYFSKNVKSPSESHSSPVLSLLLDALTQCMLIKSTVIFPISFIRPGNSPFHLRIPNT